MRALGIVIALLTVSFGVVYYWVPGAVFDARIALARLALGLDRHTVEVGDHTWPYLAGGEGDPVILLHGFGLHKDRMVPLGEALSEDHRLIIPDLPAFGENKEVAGADYSLKAQARRLHHFVEALELEEFHLIGLSYGGGIASWYATEHPDRLESLTIIGALGIHPGSESVLLEEWKKDSSKTLCIDSREDLDRVFALAYKYPPSMPDHFKDHIVGLASRFHDSHTRIFNRLGTQLGVMEPRLHLIKAPTLIIWGEEDRIFPVSAAHKFDQGIEDSRLVIIEDAGHVTFNDQRERTLTAISDFLASLDG